MFIVFDVTGYYSIFVKRKGMESVEFDFTNKIVYVYGSVKVSRVLFALGIWGMNMNTWTISSIDDDYTHPEQTPLSQHTTAASPRSPKDVLFYLYLN